MISNFFAKNMIIGMVFFVQNYQIFEPEPIVPGDGMLFSPALP
jgi:hypothetical protein